MNLLEELLEIPSARAAELKTLKEKGKKIVGYMGRFVPEELIVASGAIPYLLCRGGEPEPTEASLPYMLRFLSPFQREQIGSYLLGMDPVIPMLELIVAQCSDCHESRLADLFEYFKLPTARVGVPPDWEKSISFDYYHRMLIGLKEKLEQLTGHTISEEDLKASIDTLNQIRDYLYKICLLRKSQPPLIGGYDFIRLNHYTYFSNSDKVSGELPKLYEQLKNRKSPFPSDVPRILLAGHLVAVGDYVVPKLIESSGGAIVADFLDDGIRHYRWRVPTDGDLLKNLAETYFLKRTPPTIFQPAWEKRLAYLEQIIKDYAIDAVIWYQIAFEEIYDMEFSIISQAMEKMNMPLLKLESSYEYSREAMGPLITRIESFIHLIKQKRS